MTMKAKVHTVMPYCLRTDDKRVFMRTGACLDELAYRMRYGRVFGEKEVTITAADAMLCAEYLCALREVFAMSRVWREEWVRLNDEAADIDKKGGG